MLVDRSELGSLDAVTTAAHIAAGSLSAREVVEAAIVRTEAVEPTLNAVAAEMFEAAIARTDAQPPGPFAGVPTFVKNLEDQEGVVNGQGVRVPIATTWPPGPNRSSASSRRPGW